MTPGLPSRLIVTEYEVDALERRLDNDPARRQVRVRRHCSALVVESGPPDERIQHARLRRDGVHLWILDVRGRARWESTGDRGTMARLLDTPINHLPWLGAARA